MNLFNNNITAEVLLRTNAFSTVMNKTADSTRSMDSSSPYFYMLDNTSNRTVVLPNATTLLTGRQYYMANDTTNQIPLQKYDGTSLLTLNPGTRTHVFLTDNTSTAGAWIYESNSASAIASYSIFGTYTGSASGRYLEIYPGQGSDTAPYIVVARLALVAITLGATALSTGSVNVYKNGDFVNAIYTISLTNETVKITTGLFVIFNQGDTITLYVSGTGSIQKPRCTLYFTGV